VIRRGANKFGAKRTEWNGRRYDSGMEAARAAELQLLQDAGHITELVPQPRVELERGIFFKPDFRYQEGTRLIHEDIKGFRGGARWNLIRKIWAIHGPSVLRVTVRERGRTKVVEEILPRA
jgi:hypothetical protein